MLAGAASSSASAATRRVTVDVRVDRRDQPRPAQAESATGRFREDLYYRLNVVAIALPPLRERARGHPARSSSHFLAHASNRDPDKRVDGARPRGAATLLAPTRWPGNVRELENVIERAVALADGPVVEVQDVPLDLMLPDVRHLVDDPASLPLREARERFDRQVILRVLERVRWNQSEAARLLGLHRNSLKTKLLAWGIDPVALASAGGRADSGRPDGGGAQ